ncbi:MAG TPA: AMP-binding protein, partial [Acidimicrobiia bacterium]|nr:AMP-binding protein [Acidimicrobiia bacterium]
MAEALWRPSPARVRDARLTAFREAVQQRWGVSLDDYVALHQWSTGAPARFWDAVWDFCGVVGDRGDVALTPAAEFWSTSFFPDARLSYAENLLRRDDGAAALVFAREDGLRRVVSWAELTSLVSRLQQALLAAGVAVGDRVAAWLPNTPEAFALLLAASSIGAVFSSCSPDFGVQGVLDRFGQIEPKVLVAVDGYRYGGTTFDCLARLRDIAAQLPTTRTVVVLPYVDEAPDLAGIGGVADWDEWIGAHEPAPVECRRLGFDHPLYVLYSSGTTGLPKCIVHRAGGVLVKHLVEHQLHADVRPGDRVFYFTTTGWMMWN